MGERKKEQGERRKEKGINLSCPEIGLQEK
jgi:hypothetical protein